MGKVEATAFVCNSIGLSSLRSRICPDALHPGFGAIRSPRSPAAGPPQAAAASAARAQRVNIPKVAEELQDTLTEGQREAWALLEEAMAPLQARNRKQAALKEAKRPKPPPPSPPPPPSENVAAEEMVDGSGGDLGIPANLRPEKKHATVPPTPSELTEAADLPKDVKHGPRKALRAQKRVARGAANRNAPIQFGIERPPGEDPGAAKTGGVLDLLVGAFGEAEAEPRTVASGAANTGPVGGTTAAATVQDAFGATHWGPHKTLRTQKRVHRDGPASRNAPVQAYVEATPSEGEVALELAAANGGNAVAAAAPASESGASFWGTFGFSASTPADEQQVPHSAAAPALVESREGTFWGAFTTVAFGTPAAGPEHVVDSAASTSPEKKKKKKKGGNVADDADAPVTDATHDGARLSVAVKEIVNQDRSTTVASTPTPATVESRESATVDAVLLVAGSAEQLSGASDNVANGTPAAAQERVAASIAGNEGRRLGAVGNTPDGSFVALPAFVASTPTPVTVESREDATADAAASHDGSYGQGLGAVGHTADGMSAATQDHQAPSEAYDAQPVG